MSRYLFAFFALLCGLSLLTSNVRAENVSLAESQLSLIRANCTPVKNTLNQLHASDALMRVNRGQVYEAIGTKLMQRFNNRVRSNSLNVSTLDATYYAYQQAMGNFRTDYISYEKALSQAIQVDCKSNPAGFYSSVENARSLRAVVHSDILKLGSLVDQYQQDFLIIKAGVLGTTPGVI